MKNEGSRRPPRKRGTKERADAEALRQELRDLAALLRTQIVEIQRNRRDHEVVFARMAQLQAELDDLKRACSSLAAAGSAPRRKRRGSSG